jgi:hypothetical protein
MRFFQSTKRRQELTTVFSNYINRSRSGSIIGAVAALLFALPCGSFAQCPLTVQASTRRVGVGNTNPKSGIKGVAH